MTTQYPRRIGAFCDHDEEGLDFYPIGTPGAVEHLTTGDVEYIRADIFMKINAKLIISRNRNKWLRKEIKKLKEDGNGENY